MLLLILFNDTWAEFVMGPVPHVPSLLWAKMSRNHEEFKSRVKKVCA